MNDHERFKELAALANSGTLTTSEGAELKGHLQFCEACREIYNEYLALTSKGIALLTARYYDENEEEYGSWDDATTRRNLLARVQGSQQQASSKLDDHVWPSLQALKGAAVAACIVVAIGLGAYRLGTRAQAGAKQAQAFAENRFQKLATVTKTWSELLDAQAKKLSALQSESSRDNHELVKLRSASHKLEDRANELTAANEMTREQLRAVSQQRDALSTQLRDIEQAFQKAQAELTSLRAERDNALLRVGTLESGIGELSLVNRDQERRLRDDEQYLAVDRDIRELIGARKLYIADVFDVVSGKPTGKPFGRVFYTQGKSLIFYAFDLDRQPGVKAASIFQAWSQKGTQGGGQTPPKSLGILYQDSDLNRRWVLRCDDSEQLEEIHDLFVTVEPPGGSPKPTGKAFLYARLYVAPNHP